MAYQKPQAMIHQQFEVNAAAAADGLRAVIVGPNAILHRYADSDEKSDTYLGIYNPQNDVTYSYPGRSTGGIVDKAYSKLFVDNALLIYYDSSADATAHTFQNKANYENVVESSDFNFTAYDNVKRNDALGIRDVQVGDYLEIVTSTDVEGDCVPVLFFSRIVGFVYHFSNPSAEIDSVDGPASVTSDNQTLTAMVSGSRESEEAEALADAIAKSGDIDLVKYGIMTYDDALNANKLFAGFDVDFFYSSTNNCGAVINALVTSRETKESRSVAVKPGEAIKLSAYGDLSITFPAKEESSTTPLAYDILLSYLQAKKTVKVTVTTECAYSAITKTAITFAAGSTYKGDYDDVYVAECIQGGTLHNAVTGENDTTEYVDDVIKFSVYTAYGFDSVAETVLTYDNRSDFAVGTKGLKINFGEVLTISAGTKIRIKAKAPAVDGVRGVALADDLPETLWNTDGDTPETFNIRLIAKKDVTVPAVSDITGDTNWDAEDTQVIIKEAIKLADDDFMKSSGEYIPLSLYGYGDDAETTNIDFSKMYFEYREWSPVHSTSVEFCEGVALLDNIVGPLDIDNPLKWGVYKALTNSAGVSVAYVAVKNPEDLDDWQDALSILEGRSDVYTVVPLTTDLQVQNLVVALVNTESSAEACRWKTALFNVAIPDEKMLVGRSENNATTPTSTDGAATFGAFKDNPNESDNQFTKFVCTSGNAKFIDYGVEPGDKLRVISGANNDVVASYTIDQVYSNSTLLTMTGPNVEMKDVKFEIWHTLTKADEIALIRDRAQSFASRRIGLVWPDIVAEDTVEMPGYYLSAALAGLKSGVEPWNGLTRRVVQGFDDFSRAKPHFTETQLDQLASSGVWICAEDVDGTPLSRHAITTSTIDAFYREEMITRNFDSVSKKLYNIIDRYIGTTNVSQETLESIYLSLAGALSYYVSIGQMISYSGLVVKQHDLLLDRVIANVTVGLPFAVNNVELYITAGAYELTAVTGTNES